LCWSHVSVLSFFVIMLDPPLAPTSFPYTTLFRSVAASDDARGPAVEDARGVEWFNREPIDRVDRLSRDGRHEQGDQHHTECRSRSEEHTSELQSPDHLVCRLLLEKKKHKPAAPAW